MSRTGRGVVNVKSQSEFVVVDARVASDPRAWASVALDPRTAMKLADQITMAAEKAQAHLEATHV